MLSICFIYIFLLVLHDNVMQWGKKNYFIQRCKLYGYRYLKENAFVTMQI